MYYLPSSDSSSRPVARSDLGGDRERYRAALSDDPDLVSRAVAE